MQQSINKYEFISQISAIRPDNFTREALGLIFDYLENLEEETGEQIEFYPLNICLEYTVNTVEGIIKDYRVDVKSMADKLDNDPYITDDEYREYLTREVVEYLGYRTQIVGTLKSGEIVFCSNF